jgi:hypothetical protein
MIGRIEFDKTNLSYLDVVVLLPGREIIRDDNPILAVAGDLDPCPERTLTDRGRRRPLLAAVEKTKHDTALPDSAGGRHEGSLSKSIRCRFCAVSRGRGGLAGEAQSFALVSHWWEKRLPSIRLQGRDLSDLAFGRLDTMIGRIKFDKTNLSYLDVVALLPGREIVGDENPVGALRRSFDKLVEFPRGMATWVAN